MQGHVSRPTTVLEVELMGLSPASFGPDVDTAQRFLAGAYDSVEGLLITLETLRDIRKQAQGDIRGRLPEYELDLLRAAVVFYGGWIGCDTETIDSRHIAAPVGVQRAGSRQIRNVRGKSAALR